MIEINSLDDYVQLKNHECLEDILDVLDVDKSAEFISKIVEIINLYPCKSTETIATLLCDISKQRFDKVNGIRHYSEIFFELDRGWIKVTQYVETNSKIMFEYKISKNSTDWIKSLSRVLDTVIENRKRDISGDYN